MSSRRPEMNIEDASASFCMLYSYDSRSIVEICELKSHADRNFKLTIKTKDDTVKKYVLKFRISCLEDASEDVELLETQFEFVRFMKDSGYACSEVQRQTDGGRCVKTIKDKGASICLVYLVDFLEGTPVLDYYASTYIPDSVVYELGQLLGKWRKDVEAYSGERCDVKAWTLSNMDFVKERFDVIKDNDKLSLAQSVVSKFESEVIPVISEFAKGMTHGDFHDENTIILQSRGESSASGSILDKYGIIDFAESSFAPFVFDLATSMSFFMIAIDEGRDFVDVGGRFLAGYVDSFGAVPEIELIHLHTCMCAAYVRELIVGESDYVLQEENNEYLLTSSKNGWRQLKLLWAKQSDFVLFSGLGK